MHDEFDWDEANELKLLLRHGVRADEVEEVFYNGPQVRKHGDLYVAIGRTDAGRRLLVVFVRVDGRIRAYSARELTERERRRWR